MFLAFAFLLMLRGCCGDDTTQDTVNCGNDTTQDTVDPKTAIFGSLVRCSKSKAVGIPIRMDTRILSRH